MKLKVGLLFFLGMFFFQSPTICGQSCSNGEKITGDIFDETKSKLAKEGCSIAEWAAGKRLPKCVATLDKYENYVKDMIRFWNLKAKYAWAKIGPRRIEVGKMESGRIVSTGSRLFITPAPLNVDKVTVEIQEIDGKGKTGVFVCKVNNKNRAIKEQEWTFNDTSKKKDNQREKRKITLTGVRGHLLKINFDGKSASNTFQYKVTIKKA